MSLSGKTILVTGIAGCVGTRVTAMALERQFKVRGLQRSADKAKRVSKQFGIEVITGDVTDPAACKEACRDVDIVIHTAALVKECGELDEFRRVNVGGSVTIANAAKAAGVKVFVQISSVMVYGFDYPEQVTEDGPFYSGNNPYCLTKWESEQAVLKLNQPPNFRVIALRSGDIYGPGSDPWVVRPLHMMRTNQFFFLNGGRGVMNHVYIDNLVDAIFLAIESNISGEAFNITDGVRTSWKEYYTRLAQAADLPEPRRRIPAWLAKFLLKFMPNESTPEAIDATTRRAQYSNRKATETLGFRPRIDLDEGLKRTRQWLQQSAGEKS